MRAWPTPTPRSSWPNSVTRSAAPDAVQRTQAGAFPLEAWPAPGAITDKPTQLAETYGYDASWTLVRQLLTEVGPDRMRLVFKAAAAHQIAYAGRPAPETLPLPDGGRRLARVPGPARAGRRGA